MDSKKENTPNGRSHTQKKEGWRNESMVNAKNLMKHMIICSTIVSSQIGFLVKV